jgi:hypothetical protein
MEFQSKNQLGSDGIVGPLTWEKLVALLGALGQGGIAVMPAMSGSVFDTLRPLILIKAQQHMGQVDFSRFVNGRPQGIDFLIEMFDFAANAKLGYENFRIKGGSGWSHKPWVGMPTDVDTKRKSWCGIFAVYCYRKAGVPVRWDMGVGGPVGPIKLRSFSADFVSAMRPGDMGAVRDQNHHFIIEQIGSGPAPSVTSIDGNTTWGRIQRENKHKVGVAQGLNYYMFTQ